MKNYLLAFLLMVGISGVARADHKQIVVHVNGMVCAFCSQGLTKRFQSDPAVDKVNVNLDEKVVKVVLKHGSEMSDDTLKQHIQDAGFNVEKIIRN